MAAVANVAINVDSRGANRKLDALGKKAKKTEDAFGKLSSAVGKLAAALAVVQTAKFVFAKTAELEKQARSLQVLTGSAEKATRIIKQLQEIGRVTPFTSTELIDSAKRLNAFGVETEKVVTVTKRLADVSGASGAELSGLVTAYGQVIAKGRLQGEELLQFQERGVALQGELRRMYKLSGEEFTNALSKGRISAEAVEVAIKNLTDAGGKYANGAISQSDTLSGKFSTLQDGIDRLAVNIGTTLAPAIKTILDLAIQAVNEITILMGKGAEARNFGLQQQQLDQIDRQARDTARQMAKLRGYGMLDPRTALLQAQIGRDMLRQYGFESGQIQAPAAATAATQTATVPTLLGGNRASAGGRGIAGSDRTQQRLDAGAAIEQQLLREIELRRAATDLDRELLQINYQLADTLADINATADDSQKQRIRNLAQINAEAERMQVVQESFAAFFRQSQEQTAAFSKAQSQFAQFFKKETEQVDFLNNALQETGQILGNTLMNVFDGLINKTTDFNDVLRQTLAQVGTLLMNAGLNMLSGQQGFGFLKFLGFGGRAGGGPVSANQPYLVGERGPELFVPGASGGITNNHDMRSMMSRQRNNAPAMNFTFETTNIGGQEFVSREQLEAAMAVTRRQAASDGAQRGMNMTLDKMQQSPATRRRVGIS